MLEAPRWTAEELEAERVRAIALFRAARVEEPLEAYLGAYDLYQGVVVELLAVTGDLLGLSAAATDVLTDRRLAEACRYLSAPPFSTDDLEVVADATLSGARLRAGPAMVGRVVDVIVAALDRRRFPWVREGRQPTESERAAAIAATTALMATQRAATLRRTQGKEGQEGAVAAAFRAAGLIEVPRRTVLPGLRDAPAPGEFCGEALLGTRKADFILRLWDHRLMPIECKVSNSATNSVKRLNNDAAAKAVAWKASFGNDGVVPVGMLGGVYKLGNLEAAQNMGLTLFWAHDLQRLLDWIERTR